MLILLSISISAFLLPIIFAIQNDVDELTNNLFENLRVDPHLVGDLELSERSKAFIDKQVENYMILMLKSQETEDSRSKRSLPENETQPEDYFVDVKPYSNIPVRSPKDIELFKQNGRWYAVCLEGYSKEKYSQILKIKKFQDNSFEQLIETEISNGTRAAVFPLATSTFIVVAENRKGRKNFEHQTRIFMFNSEEELEVVQKLNTSYSSDVKIWEVEQNVYMSIAQFMKENRHETRFEVATPIYKWCGKHFDIIQFIETSAALKLSPFSIGETHFLGVTNSLSLTGDAKTYSEILKYNVQTEEYEPFQRILTYGCKDMRYFKIRLNREEEHFLIVANTYEREVYGNGTSTAPSIIYKFVDNYFIPFQSIKIRGVSEWEPIMVENGDVLLLAASTIHGLKCFQYDGWHFAESKIQFRNEVTSRGIKAMHSYKFHDKTVVVIANENDKGNSSNVFEVNFSSTNELKRLHTEMLLWCLDNEKNIEQTYDMHILGNPSRGDMSVEPDSLLQDDDTHEVTEKLKTYQSTLDDLESIFEDSLGSQKNHIIDHDFKAKRIVLNNDGFLNSSQIETINNVTVDKFFENILNINEGFDVNSIMQFDSLRTEIPIFPTTVNNLSMSSILHTSQKLEVINLMIDGNVHFVTSEIAVENIINITIDDSSILLKSGDQTFDQFSAKNLQLDSLETPFINKLELTSAENLMNNTEKIKTLQQLNAKKIVIGGFMNNICVPTIEQYALRNSGNQTILKTFCFDSIEADNLRTNTLSGKNVSNDFVAITGGSFSINKDVKFTQDISVNNLTALKYLDSIPVRDGKLDLLEKDSTERQYVSGIKSFENLELLNPIKLQGKIRSKDLDTMNPVVTIDSNLDLNGDIRITGDVIVEEIIKSNDIVTSDGVNSLRRVRQQGLKLTDPEIPIHLSFFQHINVREVFVDRINNIDPDSWVVNGAKQTQIIRGWKEFPEDLEITGDTRVFKINDIDMAELETNVLRKDGDQVISGKHYVKTAGAEKRIKTKNLKFGPHPWGTVMTTNRDQVIGGTTVFRNNLVSNITIVKNLKTNGLTNNFNFTKIAADAVTTDEALKIFGHKIFKNVTIDNLKLKNSDITSQMASLENNGIKLKGDLELPNEIAVDKIYFSGKCNGFDKDNFKMISTNEDGVQIVDGDQKFDKIIVYGLVYVSSNYVNNVSFTDFVNNTIKTDEPFHFESVTFNDVIVDNLIQLDGHVENLDLDNIFENNKTQKQTIQADKVFHENVEVIGRAHFNGLLNDINVSDICGFSSATRQKKSLVIQGDAHFAKGPHAFEFNQRSVKELEKSVWFKDKPTVITGNVEFKNNVTFNGNITVTGLVGDVILNLLATNYLSKSKNQTVSANINFLGDVLFADDVSTPKVILSGDVNEINMETFIKSVLLHESQLFENAVYFENCTVKSVEGNYLVNKLNFENEVMRYDKLNMVTDFKKFKDLNIDNLNNERNITLQNVDVLHWLKNSVLTEGDFRISGKKYFKNVTFEEGVSVRGLLNGQKFNEQTVMLRNVPQNVTGRKIFTSKEIRFKALKVKGLVNNADMAEQAHNQVFKTGDNIFKSEIHFHKNVTAKNLEIKKFCQGVNVTELLKNVTNLGALNNFEENYKNLLQMSNEIEESLTGQAYFLHYFKPVTHIPHARKVFGNGDSGENKIMAFNFENGSNILNFFEWNEAQNLFVDTSGYSINLGPYPTYIDKVKMGGRYFIFIENEVDPPVSEGHTHLGKLFHFKSNNSFDHYLFRTKGTIFITSFELETVHHYCLLFIYYDYEIDIVCDDPEGDFYLLQRITSEITHTASVININGISYLITMKKGIENEEPQTTIWKLNNNSSSFEIYQTIYEEEPTSLTTISYNCGHFLAVAYGHLQNTMHLGRVAIRRFDERSQEFIQWQNINLKTPSHIQFTILPSEELILYILTDNPTESFNVYMYEGISGFKKKIVGSAIPYIINMNQFSINNKHFVVAEHYNELSILQAVFKGEKLY